MSPETTLAKPQRVAYIECTSQGTIGGSHHSLLYLVSFLDKDRFTPIVVFYEEHRLIEQFVRAGCEVHVLKAPSPFRSPLRNTPNKLLRRVGGVLQALVNLFVLHMVPTVRHATWLKAHRIDLVHGNNSCIAHTDWVVAAAALRIPRVAHQRGIRRVIPWRSKLLSRLLNRVICISEAVRSGLVDAGIPREKLILVHNGIDPSLLVISKSRSEVLRSFTDRPVAYVLTMVGNLKPWKGQHVLLEALGLLKNRFGRIVCLFVGETSREDKSYAEELREGVRRLHLEDDVYFAGFRSDVADLMAAADVVVHASVEPEPFGRVVIESMALGRCVVASADGGVIEILEGSECGLLHTPGNSQALADDIAKLLIDPELRKRCGRAGRERVQRNFHIRTNAAKTMELYDELLNQDRKDSSKSLSACQRKSQI